MAKEGYHFVAGSFAEVDDDTPAEIVVLVDDAYEPARVQVVEHMLGMCDYRGHLIAQALDLLPQSEVVRDLVFAVEFYRVVIQLEFVEFFLLIKTKKIYYYRKEIIKGLKWTK